MVPDILGVETMDIVATGHEGGTASEGDGVLSGVGDRLSAAVRLVAQGAADSMGVGAGAAAAVTAADTGEGFLMTDDLFTTDGPPKRGISAVMSSGYFGG